VEQDNRVILTLRYKYYLLSKDITQSATLFESIRIFSLFFFLGTIFLFYLHTRFLYHEIETPMLLFNKHLEKINEKSITKIHKEKLPKDFHLLVDTINDLLNRIDTFIMYQKELFIGASHELKTPLAVIKAKNQVLLLKERDKEEYKIALKETNKKIDDMSKIISDVLNIGRQESAQFEPPIEADIVSIIRKMGNEFKLLASSQGKIINSQIEIRQFIAPIQPTLLNQIIQNFFQNAIKFTPKGKEILLKIIKTKSNTLLIKVIDEGVGIDEKVDYFAPFKRTGNKSGVGLGLFLAKSAADSMCANISLKNRTDNIRGTIASLEIKKRLICKI
jgi:two-component system OmpR family sensor kinase